MCADALLGLAQIEYRGEPDRQRNVRPFEDRPDGDRELLSAGLALIDRADFVLRLGLARDLVWSLVDSAFRTHGAIRPTLSLQHSKTSSVVPTKNVPICDSIRIHAYSVGSVRLCVKYPIAMLTKPANMTFEQAAAIPQVGALALGGLRYNGQIQPGQRVLINGAGGGVGTFAVQIARSFGAEVTGVDSTEKLDMLRSIGADYVIDYTQEDFTRNGQRYDLIIDVATSRSIFDYRRALSPGGAYGVIGGSLGQIFPDYVPGGLDFNVREQKNGHCGGETKRGPGFFTRAH